MTRPTLSSDLLESEFLRWYWLKSELMAFCRERGLSSTGSKQQIAERVAAHLSGRQAPSTGVVRRSSRKMPTEFSQDTLIGDGWRFSRELREFFAMHCGKRFRLNAPLREFMATGTGRPLSEAIALYLESLRETKRPIAKQFEYNRHMREFKASNPEATHAQAVAAWWVKRGRPDV